MQESVEPLAVGPAESKLRLVMVQTIAIFVDAYRELNARRLFWIVLMISLLIAAGFGAVGINHEGIVVFWKTFPNARFNTFILDRAEIYKILFSELGINWWLAFIATILALVSTAGIFPEFVSSGAIDLYLSKPIGRLRLFVTRYVTGLIFVALQVLVFCTASFLVIGIRGGVWEPAIFFAVPLVLLFFSYLFAVLVLSGILTRSAIAALLITIICWVFTFSFHSTEVLLLTASIGQQLQAQTHDHEIAQYQEQVERLKAAGAHLPAKGTTRPVSFDDRNLQLVELSLTEAQKTRSEDSDPFASWHRLLFALTYPLPKTTETVDLIKRELGERMHIRHEPPDDEDRDTSDSDRNIFNDRMLRFRATIQASQVLAARSDRYILGTSLAFEAVIIVLAAWIFCRRDF